MAIVANNSLKEDQKAGRASPKRISIFTLFLAFVLLATIGATGFYHFQAPNLRAQQSDINQQITVLQAEMNAFKKNNVAANQNAANSLKEIEKGELKWSKILAALAEANPKDSSNVAKVIFLSYSGSQDGKLSISAVTQPNPSVPYTAVSELLKAFNNNPYFRDAYIPALSKGTTLDGNSTLSFVLNVTFGESTFDSIISTNTSDDVDAVVPAETVEPKVTQPAVKVPRT